MKIFLNLILLVMLSLAQHLQVNAQSFLWASGAGGTGTDRGFSIATDGSGNVFVTGSFQSPSITFGSTTLTNTGTEDFYIVKYDNNGNVLWAKGAAGTLSDIGYSIAADDSGNAYVTGSFDSPSITFGSITLTNGGFFTVKFDGSGNVLWAKGAVGTGRGASCATDNNGNIYVTGIFTSPTITFGSSVLTNAGYMDIFTVKYDNGGNVLWAKSAGGTEADIGSECATDGSGNVFVTGYFYSPSASFDSITLNNASINDLFTVKYDGSGNVMWAKSAGGTDGDQGHSCATDSSGNIYITGWFNSPSLTFDTITLINANPAHKDIFTVKYDSNGNVLWAKCAGGTYDDYGQSCATDGNGNVYVTGAFAFPSITFGSITLTNAGSDDFFTVQYDSAGNVLWAVSAGGISGEFGSGITTDGSGNAYSTGVFSSPSVTFGAITLTTAGIADIFTVKINGTINNIDGSDLSVSLNIFPNPNNGKFHLHSTFCKHENVNISIFNLSGEEIYKRNSSCFGECMREVIDLSDEPPGIYFLRLLTDNGTQTKKIILQ